MFDYYRRSFPGEVILRQMKKRSVWNPILNTTNGKEDERLRDQGVARYTTMLAVLCRDREQNPPLQTVVKQQAMLDVRMGQIALTTDLGDDAAPVTPDRSRQPVDVEYRRPVSAHGERMPSTVS